MRALPTAAPPGIGKRLREARHSRHLSIEEAAWRTRIRPELLRALEREQFDPLRPTVFVRGALHSYARFLGLDPGQIVRDYSRHYEEGEPSSLERLDKEIKIARKAPRPKWLLAAVASAVALAIAGVVGALGDREAPVAAPLPALPAHTQPPAASRGVPSRVVVRIEALRSVFVVVLRDAEKVFEGTLAAGRTRTFTGTETIDVMAADGAAVRLTVNGRALGTPGDGGAVYRGRFGPRGEIPA